MRTATLGQVATWGSGGTPSRSRAEYFGTGTPWLSISDLNDGLVVHAKESLTALGVENSSAKIVPAGTLFVAMYGSIGKLGIAGREMCTSQAIAFARPRPEYVDARYLFHYLLSQRRALESRGRGGTQRNIGQGDLKAWPIPLPSLQEQRRIAAILDQADALRAKRRRSLALLDDLIQAAFLRTFGDPGTWPELWPMGTIGDTVESVTYGSSAKAGAVGEWPILRMGNLTMTGRLELQDLKYLDLSDKDVPKHTVRRGDLLFNRTNSPELVGKSAVVRTDIPLAYAGYLIRLRTTEQHTTEYLSGYLNSRHGKAVLRGMNKAIIGQANINAKELQAIRIALPPLALQQSWSRKVAAIEAERSHLEVGLTVIDELFTSLQSRAFSGELTLPAS